MIYAGKGGLTEDEDDFNQWMEEADIEGLPVAQPEAEDELAATNEASTTQYDDDDDEEVDV